jgi:hypothetical protein
MAKDLTLAEMAQRYDGEWLLIAYTELDEDMVVVRGEVLAHSPDQGAVYDALPLAKGRAVAFEYVGQVPADFAMDFMTRYRSVIDLEKAEIMLSPAP